MSANWNYRQQLIKNADSIIEVNQNKLCVTQPFFSNKSFPKNPFLYTSVNDKSEPFGYENSDLKQYYLHKKGKEYNSFSPEIYINK